MREELRAFIVERLLDLDPTLSDAAGSAIYSKVVDPLLERLGTDPLSVDIQEFILSRLQDEYPNADYRSPGSALRDLFVSPLVMLLEPLKAEIEFLRRQRSINETDTLTETELDSILDNVFATRRTGSYSLAVVRVFFSAARAFGVDSGVVFSTAGGVQFVPDRPQTFLASQFSRAGNLYYVDIPVRSVLVSADSNVAAGEIRFVSSLEGVVRVTNLTASTGGVTKETNDEFAVRAERSMSERSLNTQRGVETAILNAFTDILSVEVVGYGDPDMQRDVLQGTSSTQVELPGPILATTKNFVTVEAINGGNISLPVTNKLQITVTPPSTFPNISAGQYIRVSDLEGSFSSPLLSRPRKVAAAAFQNNVWTVTLTDFSIYSANNTWMTLQNQAVINNVSTALGFNPYARQGSAYRLVAEDSGTTYMIGAPLPFDEWAEVGGLSSVGPSSVIPGRDFLIVNSPVGVNNVARTTRCYPIHSRPTGNVVTLSRLDSFLVDPRRILYQGKDVYEHQPGISTTLESEGVSVVAFGSPALTKGNDKYDGKTLESWSKAPGIKFGVIPQNPGNDPAACTLVAEGSVLKWDAVGVTAGDYIAIADYDEANNYNGNLGASHSKLKCHAWGRITQVTPTTITVTGLDYSLFTGNTLTTAYRLFWTVYRGELEKIATDGTKSVSYTDQMLVPAYREPSNQAAVVHHPFTATYSSGPNPDDFTGEDTANRALAWQDQLFPDPASSYRSVWIRLDQNFTDYQPTLDMTPAEANLTATPTYLNISRSPLTVNGFARFKFGMQRFGLVPAQNPPSVRVWSTLSLPYAEGQAFVTLPTTNPTMTNNPDVGSNPRGQGGYLLAPNLGTGQNTTKQILQLFGSASTESTTAGGIVVSGIPSSIPLPDLLPAPQVVENDKVHIGGMTDVYVKPATSSQDTSLPIKVQPSDPSVEVLLEGSDGVVQANNLSTLVSATLENGLKLLLGIAQYGGADNLVVEILDPPAGLTPTALRILHNTGSGAKLDGSFSNAANGLKWRILRNCTVSLSDPVVVYKAGTDLKMAANTQVASSVTGFGVNPNIPGLRLRVLTGPNTGEYVISSIASNDVVVSTVFPSADSGASYQVVLPQNSGLSMPLVRVSSVSLSGSQTGVTVPYRHPVDAVSSSFAGVNDDPVISTATVSKNNNAKLQLLDAAVNFSTRGVVPGDVVRLDNYDEAYRYYRVIQLLNNTTLELDRVPVDPNGFEVFASPVSNVAYTVGHPSVGTVSLKFKEPTFIEVDGDTVFSYVDATAKVSKFRPTPQESAVLYESGQTEAGFEVQAGNPNTTHTFSSTTVNFLGLGIKVGDVVEFRTKVIRSGAFTLAGTTAQLAIVGKELVLKIDGFRYTIVITGALTTTLAGVANDINNQTGGRLLAAVVQVGQDYFLDLTTSLSLEIMNEGSIGLLGPTGALKLSVGNNAVSAQDGTVTSVVYDVNTGASTISTTSGTGWNPPTQTPVSIRVRRYGVQRVYPGEMVQEDTGLYAATVKLSSYDPFTSDQTLAGQSMTIESYRSMGYELLTSDNLYSYSVAEEPFIRLSPVVLPADAESLAVAYPLAGSTMTVAYEWSPTVAAIQSYMLQPTVRVANHNPLVRHFLPAYPVINIQYRGPTALTADSVKTQVSEFLRSLYPNRPLELFDLAAVLERAGATFVQFPQQAAFLVYDADRVARLIRSDNVIQLDRRYHIMENVDLLTVEAI